MHDIYYPAIVYVAGYTHYNGRQVHYEYARLDSFKDFSKIHGSIQGAYFVIDNMGKDVSEALYSILKEKMLQGRVIRSREILRHIKFRQGPVCWTGHRSWSGWRRRKMSFVGDFRHLIAANDEVMEEVGVHLSQKRKVRNIDWHDRDHKGEVKNWKKFRKTQYR